MFRTLLTAVLVAASTLVGSAQQAIFLVRHAERADSGTMAATTMATDPDLSTEGKARAEALAAILKDAGIKAIYTTEYKRTQQTAAPLAKALGLEPTIVPAREMASLVAKLRAGKANALVVGHSNTVGETIAALGIAEPVKIADTEYDNLFIVTPGDKPVLIRLHYH